MGKRDDLIGAIQRLEEVHTDSNSTEEDLEEAVEAVIAHAASKATASKFRKIAREQRAKQEAEQVLTIAEMHGCPDVDESLKNSKGRAMGDY